MNENKSTRERAAQVRPFVSIETSTRTARAQNEGTPIRRPCINNKNHYKKVKKVKEAFHPEYRNGKTVISRR